MTISRRYFVPRASFISDIKSDFYNLNSCFIQFQKKIICEFFHYLLFSSKIIRPNENILKMEKLEMIFFGDFGTPLLKMLILKGNRFNFNFFVCEDGLHTKIFTNFDILIQSDNIDSKSKHQLLTYLYLI